jgi:signal transduction histidine kinase
MLKDIYGLSLSGLKRLILGESMNEFTAEERFRALVVASSDVVYSMSPDWSEMRRLEGKDFIADTFEASHDWLNTYIYADDQPEVMAAIREAIRTKSIFDLEHRVRRQDGNVGWTHSRAIPLLASNGEIVEWFGSASDITALKRTEESLRIAEKLAATGRLAATMAHEINSPLAALTNLLFLAKKELGLPESTRRLLTQAEGELAWLAFIVSNTLGLQRDLPSKSELVDTTALLNDVMAVFERRTSTKTVRISAEYSACMPLWGSRLELRHVFSNILANAIDASTSGDMIRVRVRNVTSWSQEPRPGVRISIADSGRGIAIEHRRSIFSPFFTTKAGVGTGLGLWLTREIVEKHRGTIRFRSCTRRDQCGTVFSIFLPHQSGS